MWREAVGEHPAVPLRYLGQLIRLAGRTVDRLQRSRRQAAAPTGNVVTLSEWKQQRQPLLQEVSLRVERHFLEAHQFPTCSGPPSGPPSPSSPAPPKKDPS